MSIKNRVEQKLVSLGPVKSTEALTDAFSQAITAYMNDPKVVEMTPEEQEVLIRTMHKERLVKVLDIK